MKRGMTLVEIVLSLGIFTVIVWASFSWISMTAYLSSKVADPARWRVGAEALVQYIQDALASGDFAFSDAQEQPEHVVWRDSELTVETRMEGGPQTLTIRFDEPRSRIVLPSEAGVEVLLDDVVALECLVDSEDRSMQVSISGTEQSVARRLRW